MSQSHALGTSSQSLFCPEYVHLCPVNTGLLTFCVRYGQTVSHTGTGLRKHLQTGEIPETYHDFQIWKTMDVAVDYQFISNPAFNRDRGPVSAFSLRLHWAL